MKTDEIKEILYLEKYIDKYKSDEKAIINGNRLTTPAMLDYLEVKELIDYITNLQEKVNQYENPDDMTLFYMWLDTKAKDKMKQLQEENKRLLKQLEDVSLDEANIRADILLEQQDYKLKNEKAINEVIRILQIILEQPSKDKLDDLWIINKLEGIQILLQGEDKEIDQLEK